MNWYKRATKNLIFDKDVYPQVKTVAQNIVKYISSNIKEVVFKADLSSRTGANYPAVNFGAIALKDKYTNNNSVSIFLEIKYVEDYVGSYDKIGNIIYVCVNKDFSNVSKVDLNKMINWYYSVIIHEIAHSVDPKKKIDGWNYSKKLDWFLDPLETDQYCKQISEIVREKYNAANSDKNGIKNWISEGMPYKIPYNKILPEDLAIVVDQYKKQVPEIYKKLLLRVYNTLFQEKR